MRGATATAAAAAVLAACGGDDAGDPTAPVRDYVDRSQNDDMAGACEQLSDAAKKDLADNLNSAVPSIARTTDCTQALRTYVSFGGLTTAHAGVMDRKLAGPTHGSKLDFEPAEVDGDRATVRVKGSRKTVRVSRTGGRWRIDRLNFSDVR